MSGVTVAAGLDRTPLVIGHRGACGYRPEHTLGSYQLAIAMGADYVEPDLVATKDGVLVCRHENELSRTTDVASRPEFADRLATKLIDGRAVTGWFSEDFTLAELQDLRAVERFPDLRPANCRYNGKHHVPTFDELLCLVEIESRRRGEVIGVCPELKHPAYFDSIGLSLDEPLLADLRRHHLDRPNSEVLVQSFGVGILRRLSRSTRVRLVLLIDATGAPYDLIKAGDPRAYADLISASGLREISTYAFGIGVHRDLVIPRSKDGYLLGETTLAEDAHAAQLAVYAWTLRNENVCLSTDNRRGATPEAHGDAGAEVSRLLDAGIDGVVSDFPDTALAARGRWFAHSEAQLAR